MQKKQFKKNFARASKSHVPDLVNVGKRTAATKQLPWSGVNHKNITKGRLLNLQINWHVQSGKFCALGSEQSWQMRRECRPLFGWIYSSRKDGKQRKVEARDNVDTVDSLSIEFQSAILQCSECSN